MRPTLRQLEYVATVHRLGGFSLAADMLNVSQPSLSAQIAAVEAELNVRLFDRGRGGVRTTAKGTEFVRRAQRILAEVENLRGAMTSALPFAGRLRLGVLPSIGPYLLPQVVQRLHRELPELRVIVREENTLSLDDGLKSGRFDAIISTPEDHPNTRQWRLFNERLWVAVATDDPLVALKQITAGDLTGRRLLTLDKGHRLSRIVYGLAGLSGGVVSDEYEGTSLDSILLMAATGAGVAVLPELFAKRQAVHRSEVTVRPLTIKDANRDISLLFPAEAPIEEGQKLFASAIRESASTFDLRLLDVDA